MFICGSAVVLHHENVKCSKHHDFMWSSYHDLWPRRCPQCPPTPHPTLAGCSFWFQTSTPINLCLLQVTRASKVWGEVPLPEDLETDNHVKASQALLDDDEDFAADEASGGGLNDAGQPRVPAAAVLNSVFLFLHWEVSQKL